MYEFRLDFFISSLISSIDDDNLREFSFIQNKSLTLKSLFDHPIRETKYFRISVNGFQTELDAEESSRLLEISLLVMGVEWDLGVTIKSPALVVSSYSVVSSSFVGQNVRALTTKTSSEFGERLTKIYKSSINVSDKKLKLALELYNASRHDTSKRSEFLTLVMAMESLLEQESRNREAVELVELFEMNLRKSNIDKKTKESMLGSLSWLKKESIIQGLKRLANSYLHDKTYNNLSADKFIAQCYGTRSNLLHEGETEEVLQTLTGNLRDFVSEFLIRKISNKLTN